MVSERQRRTDDIPWHNRALCIASRGKKLSNVTPKVNATTMLGLGLGLAG